MSVRRITDTPAPGRHTLRRVDTGDEALTELEVIVGVDDGRAGEATASAIASADS